jgi:hypothetical protein
MCVQVWGCESDDDGVMMIALETTTQFIDLEWEKSENYKNKKRGEIYWRGKSFLSEIIFQSEKKLKIEEQKKREKKLETYSISRVNPRTYLFISIHLYPT